MLRRYARLRRQPDGICISGDRHDLKNSHCSQVAKINIFVNNLRSVVS